MSYMTDTLHSIMEAVRNQDDARFLDHLTEDVEYHYHMSSPPVRGKAGVRKFLSRYRTITADVIWRVERTAESDDCLFIEGYEQYLDLRTDERVAHPYMGIMEFTGGKISKWRDYFEMNQKVQS